MQGVSEPAAQRGVIPRAFEHVFESIQVGWATVVNCAIYPKKVLTYSVSPGLSALCTQRETFYVYVCVQASVQKIQNSW